MVALNRLQMTEPFNVLPPGKFCVAGRDINRARYLQEEHPHVNRSTRSPIYESLLAAPGSWPVHPIQQETGTPAQ